MNYDQPHDIDKPTQVFKANLGDLIPSRDDIPEEFRFSKLINTNNNPYCKFISKWFYEGVEPNEIPKPKRGIDKNKALIHLSTILGSFEPKHEHKVEAATYLASLWFKEPKIK